MKHAKLRLLVSLALGIAMIATVVFIWGMSMRTPSASEGDTAGLVGWLQNLLDPDTKISPLLFAQIVRKIGHFGEYAILALELTLLLYIWMLPKRHGFPFFSLPLVFGVFVASVDECLQYFWGRNASVWDVLLDTCGTLFGICLVYVISSLITRDWKLKIQDNVR